jgi:sensor histidine kinase YesM
MLLMTFVENIFKHGIDKSSSENKIELSLIEKDGCLLFQTKNGIHQNSGTDEPKGFGIKNLRKRLEFLYGAKFEMKIDTSGDYFTAFLKIPLT